MALPTILNKHTVYIKSNQPNNGIRLIQLMLVYVVSLNSALGQTQDTKLHISHLTGDFFIYTTYNTYEGNKIPANGMYLLTHEGVVLFDTPWDTTQFQPLLDSIQLKHHKKVSVCIATHWHSDRTEGLEYYKKQGIKTYTTTLTDEWSKKNGKKRAEFCMTKDTLFTVGQHSFTTYYPGPGHTADNIVLWFEQEKILYGGCLIKGTDASDLGYLGDANVLEYENTLRNVQKKYPNPKFIIISHSDWNNNHSLKHSIRLAKKLKKKNTTTDQH